MQQVFNMSKWNNIKDENFQLPKPFLNVLVRIQSSVPNIVNDDVMVAHYIPKFTEEYVGDDDWFDYCEERDMNFIKEGWYANTTYIGDDYSSYFIDEKVIEWKYIA